MAIGPEKWPGGGGQPPFIRRIEIALKKHILFPHNAELSAVRNEVTG
jgi:hypothetical protein